ncbi:MAG: helix-turn-helix transcriptional regulator [Gemmataceae bacterium]
MPSTTTSPVEPGVFTLAELARFLNRSLASIHRDRNLGRLPAPARLGGRPVWLRDEIQAWLEAGAPSRDEWEARRDARRKARR